MRFKIQIVSERLKSKKEEKIFKNMKNSKEPTKEIGTINSLSMIINHKFPAWHNNSNVTLNEIKTANKNLHFTKIWHWVFLSLWDIFSLTTVSKMIFSTRTGLFFCSLEAQEGVRNHRTETINECTNLNMATRMQHTLKRQQECNNARGHIECNIPNAYSCNTRQIRQLECNTACPYVHSK